MEYAPIVIPTLCRYQHFKECIDSLKNNPEAVYTDIYISLDCACKDEHLEGRNKIKKYIETEMTGFRNVFFIEPEENLGCLKNGRNLIEYVFQKNDCLIFTEDDNVFAPSALCYLNKGLEKFRNDSEIVAICANNSSLKKIKKKYRGNYIKSSNFSAHGYAIWKEKNEEFKQKISRRYINNIGKKLANMWQIFQSNQTLFFYFMDVYQKRDSICTSKDGSVQVCDITQSIFCLQENKYAIYPIDCLAINKGYDGSGSNCEIQTTITEELSQKQDFEFEKNGQVSSVNKYTKRTIGGLKRSIIEWYVWLKTKWK